ncbi:MAG: pyridoxamine 5'-phosphate oxidase family protein [Candidatus Saccharibacteria bacterium]
MNDQQIEQTIREYISQIVHMSLATSVDNKPWVCEVHFSCDDDLNVYFRSMSDRRHSQEIRQNPNVAGNIVTQHFMKQKVRGVYFEGTCEELGEVDENHPAYKATAARYGEASKIEATTDSAEGPRYYKISVKNWYLFDGYESTPAQKYRLAWGK